jgi:hypothetical protein
MAILSVFVLAPKETERECRMYGRRELDTTVRSILGTRGVVVLYEEV